MAHAKNKKSISRNSKHSSKLHASKLRSSFYPDSPAKKIILTIIILTFILVIVAVCCSFFLKDESLTKSKIENLATSYYEDYLYKNLITSNHENLDSVMEKYETYGSAPITLRQLLLYAQQKNLNYPEKILKYCDENLTYVRFYPEPPYSKNSYHTEYSYSCNF